MTEKEAIDTLRLVMNLSNDEMKAVGMAMEALKKQIPVKVKREEDTTWGIKKEIPVCPVCDYYLTPIEFVGHAEKLTWCEYCGQKIDWSEEEK